jgi:HD superfamily phosphohydrolase
LLHDIGHGPYSHTLEHCLIKGVSHEEISRIIISKLNKEFGLQLSLAIQIFENKYHKKFLHQLVSSQLDTDRLDYLTRDSFFTGVSEGVVG